MTLLTAPSPSPSHDFLRSAEDAHTAHQLNFPETFDWFFRNGLVVKTTEFFLLAYADDANDCWVVWWLEAKPARSHRALLALLLRHMPYYRPRVGWARPMKSKEFRYFSTDRLLAFTKGE